MDDIIEVNISYYPSFNTSSHLYFNKIKDSANFTITGSLSYTQPKPDTLKFKISDKQAIGIFKSFWNSKFIHSLREDTSMLGWTDGMPVYVDFWNKEKKDTVYLGNVHPKYVDSVLLQQINLLESKSATKPMKDYLKDLKTYLRE